MKSSRSPLYKRVDAEPARAGRQGRELRHVRVPLDPPRARLRRSGRSRSGARRNRAGAARAVCVSAPSRSTSRRSGPSMGDPTAAWVEQALPGALAAVARRPIWRPATATGATLVARIDDLYLGPSSGGAGRLGVYAGHDQRNASAQGAAWRLCANVPLRAISSYYPDGRRPDPGRARLAGPRDGPCAGVRGLGAEGAGTLEQIASGSARIVAAIVDRGGRGLSDGPRTASEAFRALSPVGRKGTKMVASARTRRGALAALGAFGLTLTGAFRARAQSGLRFSGVRVNVEPLRAQFGDPTAAWMEQALVQALPGALGPHLAPGDEKRAGSRGPDRLDLSRPEPRRPGAEGLGAGHDRRELPCPGAARRNRGANPLAGDCVLLSERRRPGARRARLSRAHNHVGPGLRGLGAEGARALGRGVAPEEGRQARNPAERAASTGWAWSWNEAAPEAACFFSQVSDILRAMA